MTANALSQAIEELKVHYPVSGRDDFLREAVTSASRSTSTNDEIFRLVLNFLDGGRRMSEILTQLETFSTGAEDVDLSSILAVYSDLDGDLVVGSISEITGDSSQSQSPTSSPKSDCQVSVVQVFPADVTPASRFTDASALFLTTVPTLEMSRCVPYLDLKMIFPRPPLDNVKPLSSYNFLFGKQQPSAGDSSLVDANLVLREGLVRDSSAGTVSTAAIPHTVTGMEVFTSPQTLVNAGEDSAASGRSVPVLDPFRPLMTLKSLELNVVPTTGMSSYKSAKLQFVLHDRSRMAEIADLVRPDLYSTVEILMEYGWSHPDGSSGSLSSYGKLVNNVRIREKYGVMNSSFVFGEAGQVDVTLDLYMRGVVDFTTTKIAQSKTVVELTQQIVVLTEAISAIRSKLVNSRGTAEVRGTVLLDSSSDISSALSLSKDALKELRQFLRSKENASSPDTADLYDALKNLYGKDGTTGAVKELDAELNKVVDQKLSSLTSTDPFLRSLPSEVSNFTEGTYASLGKILLRFVAEPLSSVDKFDEIHLIFYSFNAGAGLVRNANVGSFPVKVSDFRRSWAAYTKKRGKFNVTLRDFIDYFSNNFVDDPSNPAYGMGEIYKSAGFDEAGDRLPVDPAENDVTALNSAVEIRMRQIGIEDGVFRMPEISLYVEAVPLGVGLEGDVGDPEVTILRLHVFDKQSSPHLGLQQLLDAMLDKNLGTFGEPNNASEDKSKHQELASRVVAAALAEGLIEEVHDDDSDGRRTYILGQASSPRAIKSFISKLVPTIRYGTSTSAVKGISLRSLQDPLLSTVHMQRSGMGDPTNAPGVDGEIVPMQMLPTEMEVQTFGCPLVNFGQQFFVDMDTGTTVDNIYGVTKLTHRIEQGSFESSFTMTNLDAYGRYRSALNAIGQAINIVGSHLKQGSG